MGGLTTRLRWFDRGGKPMGSIGQPAAYFDPRLSPDGKRVAVELGDPQTNNGEIWLLETARGVASRFTFDPSFDAYAIWSPDGSRIVFRSNRQGSFNLYQKPSTAVEKEELLLQSNNHKYPLDWSADGSYMVYGNNEGTGLDLWVLPLAGERKPFRFLQTDFNEDQAQISPDGRWIAYISNEAGHYEVYIQSFPKPGGKWLVSANGGVAPRWRRDGKELYYIAPDGKLMAVAVRSEGAFEVSEPDQLFETQIFEGGAYVAGDRHQYDVSADGQRFLINTPVEGAESTPLTVVTNWPAARK